MTRMAIRIICRGRESVYKNNFFLFVCYFVHVSIIKKKKSFGRSNFAVANNIINFLISSSIGFLSATIGIGGGSFSVPTLTMFSKKIHEAVGTSAVFGFLIAFPGTLTFMYTGSNINELPIYSLGYVNIIIVFFISITSIFTAGIGAKVSSNIDKLVLRKIFAIFLLLTCASLIIEHFII